MPTPAERVAAIRSAEAALVAAKREFAADMGEDSVRVVIGADGTATAFVRVGPKLSEAAGKLREVSAEVWDQRPAR